MGFLAIIPGLFELLEKVIGPLLTTTAKSGIITGILGGAASKGASGILEVIEGACGKLPAEQMLEIKANIETLLAQTQLVENDQKGSNWFYKACHPMLCWGLTSICIAHFMIAEIFNILIALGLSVGRLAPLDSATLFFFGSVFGIYVGHKFVENMNNNTDQD